MPGIYPEPTTGGGLVFRDINGNPVSAAVQNAYAPGPAWQANCALTALPSDCNARLEPKQINAIVSELTAFAECLDSNGPWNCDAVGNVCAAFRNWSIAFTGEFVLKAGDTMTGPLILSGDPVLPLQATTKQYVDRLEGLGILWQGTYDPFTNMPDLTQVAYHVAGYAWTAHTTNNPTPLAVGIPGIPAGTKMYNGDLIRWDGTQAQFSIVAVGGMTYDDCNASFLLKSGGTMTGQLYLSGDPTSPTQAATKQYVDAHAGSGGGGAYLPLTGGTLTGDLWITETNPQVVLNGTMDGGQMTIAAKRNNSLRWELYLGAGSGETGGNVGSDFALWRFNDAGTAIDAPISANRASGAVYLSQILAVNGGYISASAATGQSQIIINTNQDGAKNLLVGERNGSPRWYVMLGDGGNETGGNAGTDFAIYRCADNGNPIDSPFGVVRSTGSVWLKGDPSGSSAGAGVVGEYVENLQTANVNLTPGAIVNVVQLTLQPGDWDVFGGASIYGPSNTMMYDFELSLVANNTSLIDYNSPQGLYMHSWGPGVTPFCYGHAFNGKVGRLRLSLSAAITLCLNVFAIFDTNALSAYNCFVNARRVR